MVMKISSSSSCVSCPDRSRPDQKKLFFSIFFRSTNSDKNLRLLLYSGLLAILPPNRLCLYQWEQQRDVLMGERLCNNVRKGGLYCSLWTDPISKIAVLHQVAVRWNGVMAKEEMTDDAEVVAGQKVRPVGREGGNKQRWRVPGQEGSVEIQDAAANSNKS